MSVERSREFGVQSQDQVMDLEGVAIVITYEELRHT